MYYVMSSTDNAGNRGTVRLLEEERLLFPCVYRGKFIIIIFNKDQQGRPGGVCATGVRLF